MRVMRVSEVSAYARWRQDEDADLPALIAMLNGASAESEAMRKGTAFHKALELSREGQSFDQIAQDGYTFCITGDFDLWIPPTREIRREKEYSGLTVSGQTDALIAATIYDHKTTERFDAENYLEGWQWKFYLDIFNANRFIWNVFEMKEMDEPKHFCVHKLHKLEAYRYARMEEDCRDLCREFRTFAKDTLGWSD